MAHPARRPSADAAVADATTWLQRGDDLEGRDADLLLAEPGCPACRAQAEAERLFMFWFIRESYSDPTALGAVVRSRGFCPVHTRRFLDETPTDMVPTAVYSSVVAAARLRLDESKPLEPCPACEARDRGLSGVTETLLKGLASGNLERRYREHGGLCERHALFAIHSASSPELVRLLAVSLSARLGGSRGDTVQTIVGLDADADLRDRLRGTLWQLDQQLRPAPGQSTLAAFSNRLAVDACPICLARGAIERRYLAWIGPERQREPVSLETEVADLCGRHLADLWALDPAAAQWVGGIAASRRVNELRALGGRLDEVQLEGRRRRRAAQQLEHACSAVLQSRRCAVCRAADLTEDRQSLLLRAALTDTPTRDNYAAAHGLCVRHAQGSAWPPIVKEVLGARLEAVHWELEEARRKRAWLSRYELRGPEVTAWLRAPGLIDGRAFLGGPAPAGGTLAEPTPE
jgi:hypothetical protein